MYNHRQPIFFVLHSVNEIIVELFELKQWSGEHAVSMNSACKRVIFRMDGASAIGRYCMKARVCDT